MHNRKFAYFAWLTVILLALTTIASAGAYTDVISYGDSLSDNGNLYALLIALSQPPQPPSPPYYMGRFSNGPVTVEQLTTDLGLSQTHLHDFAYGGATTGTGPAIGPVPIGMLSQVPYSFGFSSVTSALPTSLVVVWGGPNDFFDNGFSQSVADAAVSNLVTIVGELQTAGAKHILVPGMPDLGLTPSFLAQGPIVAGVATFWSNYFNTQLAKDLPGGAIYYDTAGFMHGVVNDPSAYGFTNVTMPCLVGSTPCASESEYLFWDGVHPTTAADAFLAAQFDKAVVPEPSTILMLGTGLAGIAGVLRRKLAA